MTSAALAGVRVVVPVTRAHRDLADRVRDTGATVDAVGFIEILPSSDAEALERAAVALVGGEYAWLAVTSRNAVSALATAAIAAGVSIAAAPVRVAAVGRATAMECERHGLRPEIVAAGAGAAALVGALPDASRGQSDGGTGVLAPVGNLADAALADGLEANGWRVEVVEAYRTVDGDGPSPAVVAALAAGEVDAVLVTSASVASRLARVWAGVADGTMVVAIGPSTEAAARSAGLPVTTVAAEPTRDAMIAALERAVRGKGRDDD